MKSHYAHPTGFAVGITSGIVYTACAIFVTLWPIQALRFFNDWFHGVDLTIIGKIPSITIGSYVRGLIEVMVFSYIVGVLYALLYQACEQHCRRKKWIK